MRTPLAWSQFAIAGAVALAAATFASDVGALLWFLSILAALAGAGLFAGSRLAAIPAALLALAAVSVAALTGIGNIAWSERTVTVWVVGSLLVAALEVVVAAAAVRCRDEGRVA